MHQKTCAEDGNPISSGYLCWLGSTLFFISFAFQLLADTRPHLTHCWIHQSQHHQIVAGDSIDQAFGVTLGISTLAAAGLGNLLSDVVSFELAHQSEYFVLLHIPILLSFFFDPSWCNIPKTVAAAQFTHFKRFEPTVRELKGCTPKVHHSKCTYTLLHAFSYSFPSSYLG